MNVLFLVGVSYPVRICLSDMCKSEFLELALSDLEASRVLNQSQIFPQAVFHMQQSVEKLVKHLAVTYGIHTIKELKAIGHNTLKVFQDTMNHYIELVANASGDIKSEVENLLELKEQFKTISDIDLQNLDDKFLDSVLESLYGLKTVKPIFDQDDNPIEILSQIFKLSVDLNQISAKDAKLTLERCKTDKYFQTIILEKMNSFMNYFGEYRAAVESSFYLAVVFTRHAVSTRYITGDGNPLKVYNMDHQLIRRLSDFHDHLELAINRCMNYDKHNR